ncbi:heptaprenyl diphosphate synthase component 1 [Rossellomorea aquimaris]|uniref:heptaprenyl diphosphate synthase component 1 n=1 Tax=Rossellomorea aquimaris TaxID=189382 RepID=UPI001CD704FA|nr:heptaprenyl diphosphate synthase component 1 [Rossellomorea aquimaris]MCA1054643.1 heptaprenyl diphosphate synthase component 1 [Rossellomorea aquimaris]
MKFTDYNHQANIIHQYIEEQLHHSYLKEYIDQPYVDRMLINYLLLPFMDGKRMVTEQEMKWISTAMFLHVALETHEKVTISEKDPLKERQLTVLAGVYFSSLYYKMLSDSEDIELIEVLASAIKDINECKISMYKEECTSIEELIESVRIIETSIPANFYTHFQKKDWVSLLSDSLLYNRLLKERLSVNNSQETIFQSAVKTILNRSQQQVEDRDVLGVIDLTLDRVQKDIELQVAGKEPVIPEARELLVKFLPFIEHLSTTNLYAEEG